MPSPWSGVPSLGDQVLFHPWVPRQPLKKLLLLGHGPLGKPGRPFGNAGTSLIRMAGELLPASSIGCSHT